MYTFSCLGLTQYSSSQVTCQPIYPYIIIAAENTFSMEIQTDIAVIDSTDGSRENGIVKMFGMDINWWYLNTLELE